MTAPTATIIRQRFEALWVTFSPTYLHFYAGQPVEASEINGVPWVRLTILPGESSQVGFSNAGRRKRTLGIASVQIFVPAGAGDGVAQEISDKVALVWEMTTISGVIFRATSVQRVGEDGAWLQFNADTPYQADELVT